MSIYASNVPGCKKLPTAKRDRLFHVGKRSGVFQGDSMKKQVDVVKNKQEKSGSGDKKIEIDSNCYDVGLAVERLEETKDTMETGNENRNNTMVASKNVNTISEQNDSKQNEEKVCIFCK